MKHLILILLLAACAPKAKDIPPKALASKWQSDFSPSWGMNLSRANQVTFSYDDGTTCVGDLAYEGSIQDSGVMVVSNVTTTVFVSPDQVPCSQFEKRWTYSHLANQTVVLCPEGTTNQCVVFQ